eukprot:615840-Prorocentrum_minimum.AAC.1
MNDLVRRFASDTCCRATASCSSAACRTLCDTLSASTMSIISCTASSVDARLLDSDAGDRAPRPTCGCMLHCPLPLSTLSPTSLRLVPASIPVLSALRPAGVAGLSPLSAESGALCEGALLLFSPVGVTTAAPGPGGGGRDGGVVAGARRLA